MLFDLNCIHWKPSMNVCTGRCTKSCSLAQQQWPARPLLPTDSLSSQGMTTPIKGCYCKMCSCVRLKFMDTSVLVAVKGSNKKHLHATFFKLKVIVLASFPHNEACCFYSKLSFLTNVHSHFGTCNLLKSKCCDKINVGLCCWGRNLSNSSRGLCAALTLCACHSAITQLLQPSVTLMQEWAHLWNQSVKVAGSPNLHKYY